MLILQIPSLSKPEGLFVGLLESFGSLIHWSSSSLNPPRYQRLVRQHCPNLVALDSKRFRLPDLDREAI